MSLIGEERKAIILNLLNLEGKVKTNDLVERLQVSSETVRRYLEEMEAENKLRKVYGGAIKIKHDREEPSHFKREVMWAEEKRRIGIAAVQMVQDGDVIVIDDGTTPLQMIHFLADVKQLTIITPSVPALSMLVQLQNQGLFNGDVYFIGGKVNAKHYRVTGSIAEKMMSQFHVDKAFISIDGINHKSVTSFDADKSQLTKLFVENADETILLTDHSKIGASTFYKICDLKDIDTVICNVAAPEEWKPELEKKDINWIVAE
ncbi:DeoR/GlpR family DNA-binding transcription regulator [Paenibacillus sp. MBLB4367]|uniref:DeoR/GlpR family DNA-binding transcription regulator n=1 Tax=Paenibacillus sp. MBLB4367 TaxID=3384767 RepID=UPI0039081FBE